MRLGIDFGTSYSAAAALVDGHIRHVRFADAEQLRSVAFVPQAVPTMEEFERSFDREAFAQQVRDAVRAQAMSLAEGDDATEIEVDYDEMYAIMYKNAYQDWAFERQDLVSVDELDGLVLGDDAIRAYWQAGNGRILESPKSRLGETLHGDAREVYVGVVAAILRRIRLEAAEQFGRDLCEATIGRPVVFRGTRGGSAQPEELLREAAEEAGFADVDFFAEPLAAATRIHEGLESRQTVLVVDIGGGTSDFTVARLGGSGEPEVLATSGLGGGGTDVDVQLNLHAFMPAFGNGVSGCPPSRVYYDAANVIHPEYHREFLERRFDRSVPEPYRTRLLHLQRPGASNRLNRAAERVKLRLSRHEEASVKANYIEDGLVLRADHADAEEAYSRLGAQIRRTVGRLLADSTAAVEEVYLVGGSSRSPILQRIVAEAAAGRPLRLTDPSFTVVDGLALRAAGRA